MFHENHFLFYLISSIFLIFFYACLLDSLGWIVVQCGAIWVKWGAMWCSEAQWGTVGYGNGKSNHWYCITFQIMQFRGSNRRVYNKTVWGYEITQNRKSIRLENWCENTHEYLWCNKGIAKAMMENDMRCNIIIVSTRTHDATTLNSIAQSLKISLKCISHLVLC